MVVRSTSSEILTERIGVFIAKLHCWKAALVNAVFNSVVKILLALLSLKLSHFLSACTFTFSFSYRDVDVFILALLIGGVNFVEVPYFWFISCVM